MQTITIKATAPPVNVKFSKALANPFTLPMCQDMPGDTADMARRRRRRRSRR